MSLSPSLRRSTRLANPAHRAFSTNEPPTSSTTQVDDGRPLKRIRVERKRASEKTETKPERKDRVEQVDFDPLDFPKRSGSKWKVGPHVSAAGGVENTIINAAAVGANAFALFVKSQRKWSSPPLTSESVSSFKSRLNQFNYSPSLILPHGSYLVNLGNPDKEKREKSYECFLDDLQRCEQLGLELYNFHPGSTVGQATVEESLSYIATCVNRAHIATKSITIVLENMAGAGNVLGSTFAQLADIIKDVKDKTRIGVCLDTCHLFAAGYDIRTKEDWNDVITDFDQIIGLKYLRGMHLNDSKAALGSKKDRHENIGLGHLTLTTFSHILTDPRTQNIPLILETPAFDSPSASSKMTKAKLGSRTGMEVWRKEVEVLNRISEKFGGDSARKDEGTEVDGHSVRKVLDAGKKLQKELEAWTKELKEVVVTAEGKKDSSKSKKQSGRSVEVVKGGVTSRKARVRKRKANNFEEDESESGDEH